MSAFRAYFVANHDITKLGEWQGSRASTVRSSLTRRILISTRTTHVDLVVKSFQAQQPILFSTHILSI